MTGPGEQPRETVVPGSATETARCPRTVRRNDVTDCTYCESAVEAHDPVFVYEERDGERVEAGQFCNYACLSAHVDESNLADGACCRLDV